MKCCVLLLLLMMNTCIAFSQTGKAKPALQNLHLYFQNVVNDTLLQTGVTYTNAFGEPFTVRAFKYYISDIQLLYSNKKYYKTHIPPHLVNEADSGTKHIAFTAPAGIITGIQFLLGVDSIINTLGVQTGDLDPAKGMYWVWNTGFIMAKLEGSSAAAKTPAHQFSYDIGGYKNGEGTARQIVLMVPSTVNYQPSRLIIKANVLKWFEGIYQLKIADQPMCHEPGKLAVQIADNYEKMFSIKVE